MQMQHMSGHRYRHIIRVTSRGRCALLGKFDAFYPSANVFRANTALSFYQYRY